MKKIAVAVSAALLAGSAMAANVELYGVVDTGFSYTSERAKFSMGPFDAAVSEKKFSMDSGNSAGSRWGLKGSEDLGNGYKVGFILESGFDSDTGKQADSRLFNRQSILYVSGAFGTVYVGRMYSLISDAGATGWYGAMASPFGSGWGDIVGHEAVMKMQGGMDNTLIYMSPRFSGLQFSAQYSMGDDGKENKPSTDRYAAIGADYQVGNLEVGFLVDYMNKSTAAIGTKKIDENAWTINLAANYDCGFAKSFAAVQYFRDVNDFSGTLLDNSIFSFRGVGVNLGVDIPAFGGDILASIGYADADYRYLKRKAGKIKGYTALLGYDYPISKRTSVYAGTGYTQYKDTIDGVSGSYKKSTFQAMAGLRHSF